MSYQEPPYDPYNQQQQPQSGPPYQQPQPPQYPTDQPYGGTQPYPQYQQPGYGYPAPSAQTNTMAILSLVFAFVFAPLGIVFGHMARKQIRERGEQGGGLATAGLILGYVFTAIWVIACAFYVIAFAFLASHAGTTSP